MYLELSFDLGSLDPEAAEALCFAHGALAVTYTDAQDDPVLEPQPGEIRLWPTTRLQALFDASPDREALRHAIASGCGLNPGLIHARTLADRVWEREWLKDFHAMRFGERLWVCPFHERVSDPGAVVVSLDPGLAFGTGTHPTTALCLCWLDRYLAPGMRVIDYGCGSGVLALAAAKLGAQAVHCFDIDPQALTATHDNALANAVAGCVHIHGHADSLPPGADVLLANILSGPLRELVPIFSGLVRPGGQVVLAGLMDAEAADVTAAYAPCFDVSRFGDRDGWTCLAGRRG
ncbi:MAG: 50S ribosomal protein L11 methyltransferase [Steroidobacteraceae bacterium]